MAQERGCFSSSSDFMVAVICFAVSSFVFELPYRFYFTGSGVVWFVVTLLGAIFVTVPLMSIELSLGHITGLAPTASFKAICSKLRFIGWIEVVAASLFLVKVAIEMSRYLILIIASFFDLAKWTGCGNEWNTVDCESIAYIYDCIARNGQYHSPSSITRKAYCVVAGEQTSIPAGPPGNGTRSEVIFGGLQFALHCLSSKWFSWPLAGLLIVVWILILLCTIGGPKVVGKLVYLLLALPMLLLLLLNIAIRTIDQFPVTIDEHSFEKFLAPTVSSSTSYFYWQTMWILLTGLSVYTVLASFHRGFRIENNEQLAVIRWKTALWTPWCALTGVVIAVIFIGLIQYKAVYYVTSITNLQFDNQFFTKDLFIVLPSTATVLKFGPLWCIFFYSALFLFALGTATILLLAIVTCFADDIESMNEKRRHLALVITIVLMIASFILLFDITSQHYLYLGQWLALIGIFFFMGAISLVYGWYDLRKDTIHALGIPAENEPSKWSILVDLLLPASPYHTGFMLLVGPLFVGTALCHLTVIEYAYLTVGYVIVSWVCLLTYVLLFLAISFFAVVDLLQCMSKKPFFWRLFQRSLPWQPVTTIDTYNHPEKIHYSYPSPLGNESILWCLCRYDSGLIVVFFFDIFFCVVGLLFGFLLTSNYPYSLIIAIFNLLLVVWSTLGIYRAKTHRRPEYLLPFFISKSTLAMVMPVLVFKHNMAILLCPALFLTVQGMLVAIVVGAHWRYRSWLEKSAPLI